MRIIFIYSRVFYDHDIMLLYYLFGWIFEFFY